MLVSIINAVRSSPFVEAQEYNQHVNVKVSMDTFEVNKWSSETHINHPQSDSLSDNIVSKFK